MKGIKAGWNVADMKHLVFGVCIAFVLLSAFAGVSVALVSATTIYVPDNYAKIQWAIDNASAGNTIIVRDGTYYENLKVDKQLTIKSENGSANCIVDGGGSGNVITLNADGITIEGFTVRNSGSWPDADAGIKVVSNSNKIAYNSITNNWRGIVLSSSSSNNKIYNNTVSLNNDDGIYLGYSSSNNVIANNTASNNGYGICLWYSSSNNVIANNTASNNGYGICLDFSRRNTIYLNNFIDNTGQVYSYDSINIWNSAEKITYTYNGSTYTNYLGNYRSDYTGSDADGDGIGDTPYSIDGDKDYYPLMERFENYSSKEKQNVSFTQLWKSEDIGQVQCIVVDDIDGDGTNEIVIGTYNGFDDNTWHGYIYIFNALSYELEWQSDDIGRVDKIVIQDLNSNSEKEIIAKVTHEVKNVQYDGVGDHYGYVYVFDGITHEQKWKSGNIGSGGDLVIADLDSDGVKEIITGGMDYYSCTRKGHVYVFDGADFTQKWKSEDINSLQRIVVADIDDGVKEIIFGNCITDCTSSSSEGGFYFPGHIYVYDGVSFTQEWKSADIGSPRSIVVNDVDDDGVKEIIAGLARTSEPNSDPDRGYIYVFDGRTHAQEWKSPNVNCPLVEVTDIDNDGAKEIIARTYTAHARLTGIYNGYTFMCLVGKVIVKNGRAAI